MIKLRALRWGDDPGSSRWIDIITRVLRRGKQEDQNGGGGGGANALKVEGGAQPKDVGGP